VTATGEAALDVAGLRTRFPALTRPVGGKPAIYLDGPGGSQAPDIVVRAVTEYLERHNASTDGPFVTSAATDHLLEEARLAAADLLGSEPNEIVFGATLDLAALEALIAPRTRVVACTLASNAVGSITDVDRIAQAVHAAGALLWLDGVHLAPHRRLDRVALGADVLLTSAYKYFGPHLGVAAVRKDLGTSLPADRVLPADETPAGHRFETGTLCHEAIAGFVAAVQYLESLAAEGSDRPARPAGRADPHVLLQPRRLDGGLAQRRARRTRELHL
jgi:selenocysteine lyase/cysteine desulfurase